MALRRHSKQSSITSSMSCSRVYHHHHRLHLTHLYNSNNDYLHITKQPSAERPMSLFSLAKLLVLLLILLWLLLLMWGRMIMWEITRMRLINIRTTCNHQHHNHQVVHMQIMAMLGLPDEDINTIVTPTAPVAIHTGPITRARARQ